MDIRKHQKQLSQSDFAYLPGGKDRSGNLFIVISCDFEQNNGGSDWPSDFYEDIVSLLEYFAIITEDLCGCCEFSVILDGRKALLKHLRNCLKACQHALYKRIRLVVIIHPEKFIAQQKLSFNLLKKAYVFKTVATSIQKLTKYVDVANLPLALGGMFKYDKVMWFSLREKYEDYVVKCNLWLQDLHKEDAQISNCSSEIAKTICGEEKLLKQGFEIISDLSSTNETYHNASNNFFELMMHKIELLMHQIKVVDNKPDLDTSNAHDDLRKHVNMELIDEHAKGTRSILDWIFGAAETWILTLHEIGESLDDAKQLAKDHAQLESKAKEIEYQVSDLSNVAVRLISEFPQHRSIIDKNQEQLDSVSRTFNVRVERQTRVAKKSVAFHEMLKEFSQTTDSLLEFLCTEIKINDIQSTEKEKSEMEKRVDSMERAYRILFENGVSFIDELCIDETNSLGRSVTRDYSAAIVHIRERLDETSGRRKRCQDLANVRRLKFLQLLQLYTCEADIEQTLCWMDELNENMLTNLNRIGCNDYEAAVFVQDAKKLEDTARSTYEYGKELGQAALVLRRSLRLDLQNHLALNQKLEASWNRFHRTSNEYQARLNIMDTFNAAIKETIYKLDELCYKVGGLIMNERNGNKDMNLVMESLNYDKECLINDIINLNGVAAVMIDRIQETDRSSVEKTPKSQVIAEMHLKFHCIEQKRRKLENLLLNSIWTDIESNIGDHGVDSEGRVSNFKIASITQQMNTIQGSTSVAMSSDS